MMRIMPVILVVGKERQRKKLGIKIVATDPNPYESPVASVQTTSTPNKKRRGVLFSGIMIAAGAFFCVASFYVILRSGYEVLLSSYRNIGWFAFGYMVCYGFAGLFTALFHLSYLIRGRPDQSSAGIYAILIAVGLAALMVAVLECIA